MAIIDDFKLKFPEFDTATVDLRLPAIIDEYKAFYNFAYTESTKQAVLYLLAHLLVGALADSNGPSQAMTSKSVGGVSVSYATSSSNSDRWLWLNSTKYGQRFYIITQQQRPGALFL
jgi:hypothetical protein